MNQNWDAIGDEIVGYLQTLIRFDTTNLPGNETPLANWLADLLAKEGIESVVLESAPTRGNLVARLEGTGEAEPLLLMSHSDVVPAEPDKWAHPPFGGEIHDGYIWGRGTLDMKNIVSQHLMLFLLFKRLAEKGIRLKRDLIFMVAADEERGGTYGAQWLVKHHPELVRAEYAFNEGGGRSSKIGDGLYMTVQTAEKGTSRFKLIAKGSPGHASIPQRDNAVLKLAEAVLAIGKAKLPAHITPTVRANIEGLAANQPAEMAEALLAVIADGANVDEAIAALRLNENKKRYFYAITHNTASPTILSAGSKINVFPSEAIARVDGRTLPGFSKEEFYQELAPYIPEGVELQFEDEGAALEASLDSPLYDAICASMAEHAPEVTLVPSLITGGTDAKAMVDLGTKVYGFSPALYEPEMEGLSLIHGHNERVSIKNLLFGTRVLYDVILRLCGPQS